MDGEWSQNYNDHALFMITFGRLKAYSNEDMILALAGQFKEFMQCSNQLSYEVTQLRAGQFVGLMFSRERNERNIRHIKHTVNLQHVSP